MHTVTVTTVTKIKAPTKEAADQIAQVARDAHTDGAMKRHSIAAARQEIDMRSAGHPHHHHLGDDDLEIESVTATVE